MEFDPAIVLFGAVVLLLAALLVGVIVVAISPWKQPNGEDWTIPDLDNVGSRVAAMGQEIAMLKSEIDDLDKEVEVLRDERDQLLTVLTRVGELLEQLPSRGGR